MPLFVNFIKYFVTQSASSKQIDKPVKIWTTFVEPMLGVPPRSTSVVDQYSSTKTTNHASSIIAKTMLNDNNNDVKENGEFLPNGDLKIGNSCRSLDNTENSFDSGSVSTDAKDHSPYVDHGSNGGSDVVLDVLGDETCPFSIFRTHFRKSEITYASCS